MAFADRTVSFLLVIQNIDDLHARAGCQNVPAIHGELLKCSAWNQAKISIGDAISRLTRLIRKIPLTNRGEACCDLL